MHAFICVTCGAQYRESREPPACCAICEDERQFVGLDGQQWTTLEEMAPTHSNHFEKVEPGLIMIGTRPTFAIGQHAFLLREAKVLWDCLAFIDDMTVADLAACGGVEAIGISHPHFYTTCVEWSRALGGVPIRLHADDREWLVRPDSRVSFWQGETLELADGVTVVRGGGHFPGSAMLHWAAGAGGKGVVLGSDTISVAYDRKRVTWMHSFANLIPLSPAKVWHTVEVLRPFPYDRLYSAWPQRVIHTDAQAIVRASAERYVEAMRD